MARVAWVFNGYSWPVNPLTDTDWSVALVEAENVAVGASQSRFQYTGRKSRRRQITGWLYGVHASTQLATMRGWHMNRTVATLVDHMGQSARARLTSFVPEVVPNAAEWLQGRSTWRYTAEFVEE